MFSSSCCREVSKYIVEKLGRAFKFGHHTTEGIDTIITSLVKVKYKVKVKFKTHIKAKKQVKVKVKLKVNVKVNINVKLKTRSRSWS